MSCRRQLYFLSLTVTPNHITTLLWDYTTSNGSKSLNMANFSKTGIRNVAEISASNLLIMVS